MTKKYKCRVEYLESTGTQYIDTGVIAKTGLTVEARIKYISNTGIFCGAITTTAGNGDRYYAINFSQSNKVAFTYLDSAFSASTSVTAGNYYTIKTVLGATKQEMFVNGVSSGSTSKTDNVNLNWTLGLFGLHRGGTFNPEWYSLCSATVYYVKIWNNDVLVRDFIPVLDNSGRPAMYDQVSGQLFYNQGTGEFTYGRQIIPVEYLESTGTQYIDTGFKGKNNLHYKTKVNFTTLSTGGSNGIGGEYLANASAYIGMVRANGHYTYLFNNTAVETTTTIYTNTDYEIDSVMNSGNQLLRVNGETISTGTLSGTFTSTRNIFLYAVCSTNDAADVYGSLKMYYCQIYDNDVLVRDFIPCIDENLTPFMFDKVNCTVYLNAGTGQFKVGPNIEKDWGGKKLRRKLALALANLKKKRRYYCEVEWIKTDAINSYFNTGINGDNNNLKFDIYFSTTTTDLYAPIFGNADQETQNNWGIIKGNNNSLGYANTRRNSGLNFTEYKTDGTLNHIIFYRQGNSCIMNVNGTTTNQNVVDGTSNNANIYIGRAGPTRSPTSSRECKHYRFMIYDNDVLVRDMIPVLDWSYTPCMYDKVTEQLFYNAGEGNLEYGRQIHQVEYLESTGTQYIDMGVGVKANTVFKATFSVASGATGRSYFGARNSSDERFQIVNSIGIGAGYYIATSVYPIADQKYEIEMHANGDMYLDGVKRNATNGTFSQVSFERSLWLFATNYYNSSVPPGASTFWKAQILEGDTLVRDFIPMVDEQGVGAMFDRVTHTIFDNAGTGAGFNYPPVELEYLASTGTQYIDTGLNPTDSWGYKLRNTYTVGGGEQCAIGCMDSGNRFVGVYTSGSANNLSGAWGSFVGFLPTYSWTTGDILDVEVNYKNSRKMVVSGTELKDISDVHITGTISNSIYLFARNYGSTITKMQGKIYGVEITNGQNMVADYIPAFKDGSVGMYDKVSGVLKTNIGTGSFTTGKIVEPKYE